MIDCGPPSTNAGVDIVPFNDTRLTAVIAFQCEEGGIPMTAVCGSNGEWVPNPASFKCVNGMLGKASSLYNV